MTGERQNAPAKDMTEELERRIAQLEAALVEQENSRQSLLTKLEDQQKSSQQIEQAHKEWIATFDALHDPIFLHDKEFRVLRANRAYAVRANMAIGEIIGKPYWEVFPRGTAPMASCMMAMQEAEEEEETEAVTISATGEVFLSRSFSVRDEQGAYQYSVHVLEDVTEKRRAEAERQQLSEAIHQAAVAIAVVNADACISHINPAFTRLFGYAQDEVIGKSTAILSAPAAETVQPDAALRIVREQGFFQGEMLRRARDGTILPVYINVAALHGAGGRFNGFVTAITDLRPIKQAQQALIESEAKYRLLIENLQEGIWMIDKDANTSFVNLRMAQMLGYSVEEMLGRHLFSFMDERGKEIATQKLERRKQGVREQHDFGFLRKDGSRIYVAMETAPILDEDGNYTGALAGVMDVTDRKQAEEALRESEERFRKITESAQDAIIMMGPDQCISFWNTAAERIFGYTATDAMGQEMHALITPLAAQAAFAHGFQHFCESGEGPLIGKVIEVTALRKGGEEFPIEVSIAALQLGGQWHAISIFHDITERKQAEITLNHANRALATLSAVNRNLVHATNEDELLQSICQAIVRQHGYRMAWVGYAQHDESKSIKVMAHAGYGEDYLDAMQLTWADTERGRGPSGRAIRSGATQLCQDMANDPLCQPWRDAALQRGFASSIALPLTDGNDSKVFGLLHVHAEEVNAFSPNEVDLLEEMAEDLAFGVNSLHTRHERDLALEQSRQHLEKLRNSLEDTVRAIATIVEMRDPYTAGHQARAADLAAEIARQMGLTDEQVHGIHLAGVVHDLGKIQIPAEILSKPGKISALEFSMIKVHPQAGYDILKGIDFPWPIAQMVLQHHERLDGSGYPQGLKGDAILLEARILSVADVVEAMSSHRPYRPGLGIEISLAEITKQRGSHFDPQVVDACLALFLEQHYAFKS